MHLELSSRVLSWILPVYSRVFEWWIFLLYSDGAALELVVLPAAGTGARTVGPAVQFIIHSNRRSLPKKARRILFDTF